MRKRILDASLRATHVLKKISASFELLPPSHYGIRYISKEATSQDLRNPFANENLEQELLVMQLHGKHNLLIYKFSFVYDHIVLPTIDFMPQEQSLDVVDFRAIWTAMQGSDAFSSYNCGFESGASRKNLLRSSRSTLRLLSRITYSSQPRKHMQLMTYSSLKVVTRLEMVRLPSINRRRLEWRHPPLLHFIDRKLHDYPATEIIQLPEHPFYTALKLPIINSDKAADAIAAIYDKVLQPVNRKKIFRIVNGVASTRSLQYSANDIFFYRFKAIKASKSIELASSGPFFLINKKAERHFQDARWTNGVAKPGHVPNRHNYIYLKKAFVINNSKATSFPKMSIARAKC
ncbi:uncharacterized protein CCR75_006078 [Bremia lactucae]|uniref:Ap4A phosphorylase 1/2 N-terminal domain-containing protein n=1 Tax=Bremia lactucae TaxID=4779 RepID=A0A976FGV5_BRELC|nr:hypothetical protein CCR75_006078 [Bremia lactucae]